MSVTGNFGAVRSLKCIDGLCCGVRSKKNHAIVNNGMTTRLQSSRLDCSVTHTLPRNGFFYWQKAQKSRTYSTLETRTFSEIFTARAESVTPLACILQNAGRLRLTGDHYRCLRRRWLRLRLKLRLRLIVFRVHHWLILINRSIDQSMTFIKPHPHQQQRRSNVRLCCQKRQQCRTSFALKFRPFDKVERCFDNVASTLLLVWTGL